MLRQEVLKIVRRRGMYWSFVGLCLAAVVGVLVTALVVRATGRDSVSGRDLLQTMTTLLLFAGLVMGVLVGAQEGAYDVQQGTFRYLVMTGRSKLGLYLLRIPAFLIAVAAALLPGVMLALIASAVVPLETFDVHPDLTDYVQAFWLPFLFAAVFGLISLAVGALLRSVGAAIAVALVLNLAGLQLFQLLTLISDSLWVVVLPNAVGVLSGDDGASVWAAIVVVVCWLAAFVGAGALRTTRSEY